MASTLLSERAKAMAIAAGWKLRHKQIFLPGGKGQLVCQDADGRTLMLKLAAQRHLDHGPVASRRLALRRLSWHKQGSVFYYLCAIL